MKNLLKLIGVIILLVLIVAAIIKYPPEQIPNYNEQQLEFIQNEEGLK